MTSIWNFIQ